MANRSLWECIMEQDQQRILKRRIHHAKPTLKALWLTPTEKLSFMHRCHSRSPTVQIATQAVA
eukprot:8674071-Karenia_brevis.AAC.1